VSWIAFTVDVEEWFHILDADSAPRPATWNEQTSRIERNTRTLLDHLDAAGVSGTFFTLGWVAERYPELVREIARRGHEVASHGHEHVLAFRVGRELFREDVRRSKQALEAALGEEVIGYRAAGFSITEETPWAFEELAEAGFRYDSSVFPAKRGHGGFPDGLPVPHRIAVGGGRDLVEFPIPPLDLGVLQIPFSGGGYLRLLPAPFVRACIRRSLAQGTPVNVYVHPREVDPGQPRVPLSRKRNFMTYVNIRRGESKILSLLRSFPPDRFRRLADALEEVERATNLETLRF
jgi:polysaccharide deacetylase family protein (PEP-CTERM system associated)